MSWEVLTHDTAQVCAGRARKAGVCVVREQGFGCLETEDVCSLQLLNRYGERGGDIEGERERGREGERERGREGGRERGSERERERGREGGREEGGDLHDSVDRIERHRQR
eukprot:128033-Rhodomonas_salina.1